MRYVLPAFLLLAACNQGSENANVVEPLPVEVDAAETDAVEAIAPVRLSRTERIKAGAQRIADMPIGGTPEASTDQRIGWVANLFFSGCPSADDWFDMQDRVFSGDYNAELPSRCFEIEPGDRLFAHGHGHREISTHEGHEYEKATTADGRDFWADSLDSMSISPIE